LDACDEQSRDRLGAFGCSRLRATLRRSHLFAFFWYGCGLGSLPYGRFRGSGWAADSFGEKLRGAGIAAGGILQDGQGFRF
jgi:hypothetical protein